MSVKNKPERPVLIELEQFLPYRLNVVAEAVSRALSKIYAERYGITIPEWRVIATLGQYERMTARDIGRHSRMHKTKVSRAVARLGDRGLVVKAHNANDMREAFLTLSREGREIYRDIVPSALEFAEGLFHGVSEADKMALDRLLSALERKAGGEG